MKITQALRQMLGNLTCTASEVYQLWQTRQRAETLTGYTRPSASNTSMAVFNALADLTPRPARSSSH